MQCYLQAIEKYGSENFEVEIIQYPNISREALCEVEKLKIKQLNTIAPNGYNLTTGGQGWIPTEAINQKRSKSLKGKPKSKEHRQALSEARQGFRFRMTEKHKRNMARNGSSNGSFRKDLNRTEICQRYLLGESAKELAKAFDAGETTIYRILRKHNIERRSSAETQRLQNARK